MVIPKGKNMGDYSEFRNKVCPDFVFGMTYLLRKKITKWWFWGEIHGRLFRILKEGV